MPSLNETRRRFLNSFTGLGFGGTLLPGVLWSQVQQNGTQTVTREMLDGALALSGVTMSEADRQAMLQAVNQNLTRYQDVRNLHIPNNIAPPFYFNPLLPGMKVNRTREPLRFSTPSVKRPANLEEVAFWPVTQLAQLLKSRQATSLELTEMYLARLRQHNPKLNCVVTFLDELAVAQAKQADREISAGKYKGPLHGIPWGAKDIMAVKGHKTTWGSDVYKDQVIEEESSVVEMLREAGAVLLAKLTTGELAQGDRWFGGQTKNPWNPAEGSSGSSAGPAAATAAGLVGFAIGTETSGSILSPSARCGVTGLRPTFGRISRYGVMTLSWTQDRLGPMCRYAEDCALVMSVIGRPDQRDMSVSDIPFNWNSHLDVRKLRVGFLEAAFEEARDDKPLTQMQSLGLKLVPLKVPDWTVDVSSISVESAVFFDDLVRSGNDKKLTNPDRATSWRSARAVPAVEYLQNQRARTMMMMALAEATREVDVYLAPVIPPGAGAAAAGGGRGGRGGAGGGGSRSVTQRHFTMANVAGYPALNIPTGLNQAGSPTNVTLYGRPFGETEVLALGKAYQDSAGFYRKHPNLT